MNQSDDFLVELGNELGQIVPVKSPHGSLDDTAAVRQS